MAGGAGMLPRRKFPKKIRIIAGMSSQESRSVPVR